LRAAIDWSYDLLSETERAVLGCVSVFAGGFTPEAAQRLVRDAGQGLTPTEVLFYLSRLAEKSLLLVEVNADGERYRFLETIREYASEKLQQGEWAGAACEGHRLYYLGMAEDAVPALTGSQQAEWLNRLEREHDNLRAALRWSLDSARAGEAMRLAGALTRFWRVRGYVGEARRWFDAVLEADAAGPALTPRDPHFADRAVLRSRVLNSAGTMAWEQADYPRARSLYEQSLNLRLNLEDQWGIAQSLGNLGYVAFSEGDLDVARTRMQECLELYRELGDQRAIADWLTNLGNIADHQSDYQAAAAYYDDGLALQRALGDKRGISNVLNNLGNVATHQSDYPRARALYDESLSIRRELEDKQGIAASLSNLSDLCWHEGDRSQALNLSAQSLALRREIGDREGIAISLCQIVFFALARGDLATARSNLVEQLTLSRDIGNPLQLAYGLERAAALAASLAASRPAWLDHGVSYQSAADALRAQHHLPLPANERPARAELLSEFRRRLDAARFEAAWQAGATTPLDQLVAAAIDDFRNSQSAPATSH
jgi:tetratricopeptide (TPR) repeat protein